MRTNTKVKFEGEFYKLMNNAVFGKTMENVRNRQNIRFATSWKEASRLINKPSFKREEVFFRELFCYSYGKGKYCNGSPNLYWNSSS